MNSSLSNLIQGSGDDSVGPLIRPIEVPDVVESTSNFLTFQFEFSSLANFLSNYNDICNIIPIPNVDNIFVLQNNNDPTKIKLVRDATQYKIVSNQTPNNFDIFGDAGFIISFQIYEDNGVTYTLKQFCSRSAFDLVIYCNLEDCEIPLYIKIFTKHHDTIENANVPTIDAVRRLLYSDVFFDLDAIIHDYPRVSLDLPNKLECVKWFTNKKAKIRDINHILKIDVILKNLFQMDLVGE